MAKKSSGGCCSGCVLGVIAVIIIIALVVVLFLSRYFTIEQVGLADKEGILHNFDEKYKEEDTFRSLGMESWKVWDILIWIIKSGDYKPA